MAILGREIIGQKHNKTKELHVEEWGGSILIRQLSHREVVAVQGMAREAVDRATQSIKDGAKLTRFNFELIRLSWINEDGGLVLTPADYDALMDEPNAVIKKLTDGMAEFSGLSDAAEKEAEKN